MGVVQLAELSRNGEAGGGRRRWRNTRRLRMAGWSGWPPARIDGDGGWGGAGAGRPIDLFSVGAAQDGPEYACYDFA